MPEYLAIILGLAVYAMLAYAAWMITR